MKMREVIGAIVMVVSVAASAGEDITKRAGFQLGFELDVDRKTPKMEVLERYADILADLGYNHFQLYNEYAFAYTNHPAMHHDTEPYTAAEIIHLRDYCKARGVTLVANQNSFGHLQNWLGHKEYNHLAEAPKGFSLNEKGLPKLKSGPMCLCATAPESFVFLVGLYDEFLPLFESPYVHIGCDETWDIFAKAPEGRSAGVVDARGAGRVYLDFVSMAGALVRARGKTPMYWHDMLWRDRSLIPMMPKDMVAMIWHYEKTAPFDEMAKTFKSAGLRFFLCPGTSAWCSLFGRVENMQTNVARAVNAATKYNAEGLLITEWGSGWVPQPQIVNLPALIWMARLAQGREMNDALLIQELDRICKAKVGAALVRYGNAYLKCGALRGNGTYLYDYVYPGPKPKLPSAVTREKLEEALAEIDAAKALVNLDGAPTWVSQDMQMIDIHARILKAKIREDYAALTDKALRNEYIDVWCLQNRPRRRAEHIANCMLAAPKAK